MDAEIFHLGPRQGLVAVRPQTVVVDTLLIVTPIVGFYNCSMFCCALLCVHSSFAIISMGKRKSWLLCYVCLLGVS